MQGSGAIETDRAPDVTEWRCAVFEEQQAPLVAYVAHLVGDLESARDVVQDAFLRLCNEEDRQVRDHAVPWLYTVCRRRALDLLRKERRMHTVDDAQLERTPSREPTPAAAAESREAAGRALCLLNRLPPNQREVLVLKFQNALSYREISDVTGLSVGNVGFLIHTGLKQLRRQLAGEPALATDPVRRAP